MDANLRACAHEHLHGGPNTRYCCQPYGICSELIARKCGSILRDECGEPLQSPLDAKSTEMWRGYVHQAIQQQIEPALLQLLHES